MIQCGDALGFPVEPRAAFRACDTRLAEDLNRDRAIQLEIAGAIHVAHAAAADQGLDLVRTEVCALCEGHNYCAGTRAFSSSVPLNTTMIFEYVATGLGRTNLIFKNRSSGSCRSRDAPRPCRSRRGRLDVLEQADEKVSLMAKG